MEIFDDKIFENIDFTVKLLPKGEYESCSFINCNLSSVDVSHYTFIDTNFVGCNLSLLKLNNTILRDISFKGCKMIGLQFCDANSFGLSMDFDNCILTNSSFYKLKLKKRNFINSKINEVDFSEADLAESIFAHSDLSGAVFSFTNLERADFRDALNYSIDPEKNKVKKSKHSLIGVGGLLDKYQIVIE
jgi:fluoroquinolone resistance protein